MKKWIMTGSVALAAGLVLWTSNYLTVDARKSEKIISYHGQVMPFSNLSELEEDAPIIVHATFTGERETIPSNLVEGKVFRSDSVVEIKKVFEGDLQKNDNIIVYEPAIVDENGAYFTINGYSLMVENETYTLFLKPVKNKKGYAIAGLYQGKYNNRIHENGKNIRKNFEYNDLSEVDYFGDQIEHYNQLKEQVVKKYKLVE
ncbi:hypothetical protein [Brevibacillus parabrevis]|jgi:hypothetical protein|uniref:Uncharacterized protein n=1 Tax=Brevibacillus parabrevis TaxID=54914 RepID=A0A4Y3PXJ3_BREPA|nr:hypothetical protein [Brevibacillus parabrevis]MDR5000158.1 hypothetical protein [Brevibacillus parabrevis]RNB96405.1 hypothetical protein EDM60_03495 [Brevibacillus parabrevis]GEB35931.1 hypothetical protein BPA01_55110 [Brevibacillus parabrevis]